MTELILRERVFIAQPPLYRIKKGKSEKYIKDEKEFTKEIMRRATENLTVEIHSNGAGPRALLEGTELRTFLLGLDEYEQMVHKVQRKLRDPRRGGGAGERQSARGQQGGFSGGGQPAAVFEALEKLGLNPEMRRDEEHSSYAVVYRDGTHAERSVGLALAAAPEYRRFRALARATARYNDPPSWPSRTSAASRKGTGSTCSTTSRREGKRDASVQRYKGLAK